MWIISVEQVEGAGYSGVGFVFTNTLGEERPSTSVYRGRREEEGHYQRRVAAAIQRTEEWMEKKKFYREKSEQKAEIEAYLYRIAAMKYRKMEKRKTLQSYLIADLFLCGLTAVELLRDSKRKMKATTTQDGKIFIVCQSKNKDYVSITVSSSSGVTLEKKLGVKRGMLSGVLGGLGIDPTNKRWEAEETWPFWGEGDPLVYFIKKPDRIKIGLSKDPAKRLKALQTAQDYPLELLAVMEGGSPLEHMLHEYFSEYCVRGEWYMVTQEMLDFIEKFATRVG